MSGLTPYLLLPGTAREAIETYHRIFGGDVDLATFAEFDREDGPEDAIAHATIVGPVMLFIADAGEGEQSFEAPSGLMFSLLGADEPEVLTRWFDALADGGEVLDPLQKRPWGDVDGQVRDRFGVTWLIGHQG